MSDTTTRALSLLNLLQTHRHWPGSELADRLGVTERTVRRDVERLRDLGYRIESVARAPPAATGSRPAAPCRRCCSPTRRPSPWRSGCGSRHPSGSSAVPRRRITALAKLEQVLPAAAAPRGSTRSPTAVQPAGLNAGAAVSGEVLGELALACRDHERVRFTLHRGIRRGHPIAASSRTPSRPPTGTGTCSAGTSTSDDWRTFRVDRLADVEHTRVLFEPRPLTPEQIEEFIFVARSWVRQAVEADAVMELPLERDARVLRAVGPGRRG